MKRKLTRKIKNGLWLMLSVMLLSLTTYAQSKRITGKVISEDDQQSLPGAIVTVKGTNVQAPTDINGNYIIQAKAGNVIVFSFIGYKSKEVTVGALETINVTLSTFATNLTEVVAVGYATQKRKDLTGAISSISAKDIASTVSTTFDQALQGKVAGVIVEQNSGQPGGGTTVIIRGLNTLLGQKEPLYVIDGVIFAPNNSSSTAGIYMGNSQINNNPLSTINPSDISTIDVLKDASAIAIYGSQGSNGVIVVTTKRGQVGAPKINLDSYYSLQSTYRKLPIMDLHEFSNYLTTKYTTLGYGLNGPLFTNPKYLGSGTDWQNELFKNAGQYNANLAISGGDTRTTYYMAGNYYRQDGSAIGSNFNRSSFKISVDNKTTDWLKIGSNLYFAGVKENVNNSQYDLINSALGLTPDLVPQNPDGSISVPSYYSGGYIPNPVAAANLNTNLIKRTQASGNFYADIYLTKDITLRNELAGNYEFGNVNQFFPPITIFNGTTSSTNIGSAGVSSTSNIGYTVRSLLTYNHSFKNVFNVNVLAGHEASTGVYTFLSGGRSNFVSDRPQGLSLGIGPQTNGGGSSDYANEGYLGRASVNYKEKYYLTSSIRADGNSNFAPGNRWVTTYSFGGAWDIAKESFLKNVTSIDQIKLRAGYGLTNNANIGSFKYGASVRLSPVALGSGAYVSNIANPGVKWETTTGYNAGIDITILKSRIQLTADAYYRTTDNLLLNLPLPRFAGTDGTGQLNTPVGNVGSIQNKGMEFSLNTHNIQRKDFTWNSTINFSFERSKVTALNDPNTAYNGIIDNGGVTVTRTAVGTSIGDFYGYVTDGIFKDKNDLVNSPKPSNLTIDQKNGIWVGDIKYKDLDGNGVIDTKDQTDLGSPLPKFQFGFNNTFSYKGFDLSMFFNGNYGNKILNYLRVKHEDPNSGFTGYFTSVNDFARLTGTAVSQTDPGTVAVSNPNTLVPAFRVSGDPNSNTRISDRFIEDGSYIRLKNLNLGYKLPTSLLSKLKVNSARIYVSMSNVFTLTRYSGLDPEVGFSLPSSGGSNSFTNGIDYGHYPSPRFYTVGFNVGL